MGAIDGEVCIHLPDDHGSIANYHDVLHGVVDAVVLEGAGAELEVLVARTAWLSSGS